MMCDKMLKGKSTLIKEEILMFDFLFNWSSEFDTHIQNIDEHHQQFFSIGRDIEQLLQMNCIGVTDKQLLDIVMNLKEYVSYHFYEEETLMIDYGYPEFEEHKEYHRLFSKRIANTNIPALKENPVGELKKIRELLLDMVFGHILVHDKKMADFVLQMQKKMQEDVEALQKKEKQEDEIYGIKLGELDITNVYLYRNQNSKGHCFLLHKEKAKDLSRLSILERNFFFSDVARTAKAIQTIFHPQAFNYVSYGDIEPTLHFHVIPKYEEEGLWQQAYTPEMDEANNVEDIDEEIIHKLKKELGFEK